MKCMLGQRPKNRLTKAQERELQGIVNGAFALSIAVGPKKACEILRNSTERKSENE